MLLTLGCPYQRLASSQPLIFNRINGKPGETGSGEEDPDSGTLEKVGDGMSLGGGLGNRGVIDAPTFDPVGVSADNGQPVIFALCAFLLQHTLGLKDSDHSGRV